MYCRLDDVTTTLFTQTLPPGPQGRFEITIRIDARERRELPSPRHSRLALCRVSNLCVTFSAMETPVLYIGRCKFLARAAVSGNFMSRHRVLAFSKKSEEG